MPGRGNLAKQHYQQRRVQPRSGRRDRPKQGPPENPEKKLRTVTWAQQHGVTCWLSGHSTDPTLSLYFNLKHYGMVAVKEETFFERLEEAGVELTTDEEKKYFVEQYFYPNRDGRFIFNHELMRKINSNRLNRINSRIFDGRLEI